MLPAKWAARLDVRSGGEEEEEEDEDADDDEGPIKEVSAAKQSSKRATKRRVVVAGLSRCTALVGSPSFLHNDFFSINAIHLLMAPFSFFSFALFFFPSLPSLLVLVFPPPSVRVSENRNSWASDEAAHPHADEIAANSECPSIHPSVHFSSRHGVACRFFLGRLLALSRSPPLLASPLRCLVGGGHTHFITKTSTNLSQVQMIYPLPPRNEQIYE